MNKFTPGGTLLIILLISFFLGFFALLVERFYSAQVSFVLFIVFAGIYYFFAYYFENKRTKGRVKNV
jgi:membrane protein implicated in regulation of membrane protease activity